MRRPLGVATGQYIGVVKCPDCGDGWTKITTKHGVDIAVVWRRSGLTAACGNADLVFSVVSVANALCESCVDIIDPDVMARRGGVFIFARNNGQVELTIQHVKPQ